MKQEYDFSNAERGKFFKSSAKMHLPIYLEADIETFFRSIADKKNKDAVSLINELLRRDMENIRTAS